MKTMFASGLLLLLVVVAMPLCAQTSPSPSSQNSPAAPLPPQIAAAKKVFISYAGQDKNPRAGFTGQYSGDRNRAYNQFYAAIKTWGRYEVVSAPTDADLVLELSFNQPIVWGKWADDTFSDDAFFRLVVRDPRTSIALWGFTEHVASANRKSNRDKNFDMSLENIVKDLQGLVGGA